MSSVEEGRPPRLIARFLQAILPAGTIGRSIMGDIHEEFVDRAQRRRGVANMWYVGVALRLGVRYVPDATGRAARSLLKTRPGETMHAILQDMKFAIRRLRKQPAFTVTAVAIIGLGIGANTAIFSIVNAVLFKPQPYSSPETLVRVFTNSKNSEEPSAVSYPDFLDYREVTSHFSDAAATETTILTLGTNEGSEAVMGEILSANFFTMTGLEPVLGRTYLPEEDTPGVAPPVTILSYNAWERRYGRDPDIIGQDVRLNNRTVTIIGVGPRHFTGTFVGLTTDFWIPFGTAGTIDAAIAEGMRQRGSRGLFVFARLQNGVTNTEAATALNVLAASLGAEFPDTNEDRTVTVLPSNSVRLHPMIDAILYPVAGLLLSVVTIVLLVACTNLANLLLVRASSSSREVAVRMALGSPRWRVITQQLVESTLIGLMGGLVGLLIAAAAARAIVSFHPPLPVPVAIDLRIDRAVLAFTAGLSLVTGILFGIVPAFRGSRPNLVPSLKDGARSIDLAGKRFGLRNLLVITQIILSSMLLISAGLFVRSLRNAQDADPGFRTEGIGMATFDVSRSRHEDAESGRAFFQRYTEEIASEPGVQSVALVERLTLGMGIATKTIRTPEMELTPNTPLPEIDYLVADGNFFTTMEIPLIRGRPFDDSDTETAPAVVIVGEALALRFWNTVDAVGREIIIGSRQDSPSATVIGVARDIKVRTLGESPRPLFYRPFSQNYLAMMSVLAETSGDPSALVGVMRRTLRDMDPEIPMFEAKTIGEHFSIALFAPQMGAVLISLFGALALVLASIGLYGVMAVSVAQRTREVGVRVALGAARSNVIALIMKQGMVLAVIGLTIGLAFSVPLLRGLNGFLIGVPAHDPLTYAGVAFVLLCVTACATYIPARRAANIDPQSALRYE